MSICYHDDAVEVGMPEYVIEREIPGVFRCALVQGNLPRRETSMAPSRALFPPTDLVVFKVKADFF